MSITVEIVAVLDPEHEAELRVRPGRGEVEIECEDWSGTERRTTRVVMTPGDAARFSRALMRAAGVAKKRGAP